MSTPASSDLSDQTPLVSTSSISPGDVPEYERDLAAKTSLAKGDEGGDTVAHVDSGPLSSHDINVDDKTAYTAADQAHELQHVSQITNTPLTQKLKNQVDPANATIAGTVASKTGADTQDYGGTEGLQKHLASGKTVGDLSAEQQASIPQNYMKEYVKAEKSGDAKAIDKLNKVYEPAIRQLRNMANPSNTTINTTPDAPGAPPASATGVAVPVKGMLSNSTRSVALKASDVHNPPPKASAPKTVAKSGKGWYNAGKALGQ